MNDKFSIDELLIGKYTGELSPDELIFIDQLIASNPKVKSDWNHLLILMETPEARSHFDTLIPEDEFRKFNRLRRRRSLRPVYYSAAGLLLLIAIALYLYLHARPVIDLPPATPDSVSLTLSTGESYSLPRNGQVTYGKSSLLLRNDTLTIKSGERKSELCTLSVPNGKRYQVILQDGSLVTMNTASSLKFPLSFGNGDREITVSGEAYFAVQPGARSFVVHAPLGSVQVLGTEFNIKTYNGFEVALAKGSLKVSTKASTVQLKPGQKASTASDGAALQVEPLDPQDLDWRDGDEWINNANVNEVAQVIIRHYNVKVFIDRPIDSSLTYSFLLNSSIQGLPHFLECLTSVRPYIFSLDSAGQVHIR